MGYATGIRRGAAEVPARAARAGTAGRAAPRPL
jgi:hypothetical protein